MCIFHPSAHILRIKVRTYFRFSAFCEHLGWGEGGGTLAGKCVYQTFNLCFVSCGMPPPPLHSREHNNRTFWHKNLLCLALWHSMLKNTLFISYINVVKGLSHEILQPISGFYTFLAVKKLYIESLTNYSVGGTVAQ